jgi:1-pyrroline-5-carboxylate dehydrogenase
MSTFGRSKTPTPINEPVRSYAPGSTERASIKAELERQSSSELEVPLRINGEKVRTGNTEKMVMPHKHQHVLGHYHQAGPEEVQKAIAAAEAARPGWAALPVEERAAVFLRAGVLLENRFRDRLNASTMLNQSKTVHQAEIDAACEMIDFFRFNVHYMERIYAEQPASSPGIWNRLEYRPLDGFVFAVTPFNFTSIAANLCAAPAMCGNTIVWKPGPTAMLGSHYVMELFEEAGLPPGVINMIPGDPPMVGNAVMGHRNMAGVHFTGSTATFKHLWRQVGENLDTYVSYPRVVGETGGKDFIVAHKSADPIALAVAMVRGSFEYQGQKCSAASRAYIPSNLWDQVKDEVTTRMATLKVGDVRDFSNFMGAVIDQRAYDKHSKAIETAKANIGKGVVEVIGGEHSDETGYFVHPTVIVVDDPKYQTMGEELFGPILTVYVYDENEFEQTLALCDETSPYALTGAIFATDRRAVAAAVEGLRFAAGNFYINDKPTGAVVGQQPFGGSRASGTNDKAGSIWNLLRWMSPRTLKENLAPPHDHTYPFLRED